MGRHWLDKYIKEQKVTRKALGRNSAEIQEMAEMENWDSPKNQQKMKLYSKLRKRGLTVDEADQSISYRKKHKLGYKY